MPVRYLPPSTSVRSPSPGHQPLTRVAMTADEQAARALLAMLGQGPPLPTPATGGEGVTAIAASTAGATKEARSGGRGAEGNAAGQRINSRARGNLATCLHRSSVVVRLTLGSLWFPRARHTHLKQPLNFLGACVFARCPIAGQWRRYSPWTRSGRWQLLAHWDGHALKARSLCAHVVSHIMLPSYYPPSPTHPLSSQPPPPPLPTAGQRSLVLRGRHAHCIRPT